MKSDPVLAVRDLSVTLPLARGAELHAVRGVSFTVERGETLCLVGESGCGKSTVALSVCALLAAGAKRSGEIRLFGEDIANASAARMAALRGGQIAMIFQDPMTSLNPAYPIGNQLIEGLLHHEPAVTRKAAVARAIALLETCGITQAAQRLRQYPHQLSGGLRQRVTIAMALMTRPALLLADEPTTALDVTIQAQILELLKRLQREFELALILITHDLRVVREVADRVAVMYAGEIVETAPTAQLFEQPCHPYTRALLSCVPGIDTLPRSRLGQLPGLVPSLVGQLEGCQFRARCSHAVPACSGPVPQRVEGAERYYRCVFNVDALDAQPQAAWIDASFVEQNASPEECVVALELRGVEMIYRLERGLFASHAQLAALRGVDLTITLGSVIGIVGESGCGKTTLSRIMLGMTTPTSGTVRLMGQPIQPLARLTRARWIQPVFQDPYASLNPKQSIEAIIRAPLEVHGIGTAQERGAKVRQIMDACGLPARLRQAYPAQLSGGQRQRVAIASALVMRPKIIVCDEPTSSLDASVQSQILNLLLDLRREFALTYVLISHDLAVIRHMADRIVVMRRGEIVEEGAGPAIFNHPAHPYTRALLAARGLGQAQ
jgi:peptide/nickel transport system ATP-binding protein